MPTKYQQSRYEIVRRNTATLKHIFALAEAETTEAMRGAVNLETPVFGGFVRKVLPPIMTKWGAVSATAAMQHYEAARREWQIAHGNEITVGKYTADGPYTIFQPAVNTHAERVYAKKVVQGRIYQARLASMDVESMTNELVDHVMAAQVKNGGLAGSSAAANAMTRQIGAYYRDTMLFNAGLDDQVVGVQRIVHPRGCAWCKTLAVGGVGRNRRIVLDFAMHFHDHCKCSIEPLFRGDKPIRPDYYDEIEQEIKRAYSGDIDPNVMRSLRPNSKTNPAMRALVQQVRAASRQTPQNSSVSRSEPVSASAKTNTSPAVPSVPKQRAPSELKSGQHYWQKDFKGDQVADIKLARQTALDDAISLPRLKEPEDALTAGKKTNPNYGVKPGYTNNCARVVHAYELRRRGYDVTAGSQIAGTPFSQTVYNYARVWGDSATGEDAYSLKQTIPKGLRDKEKWLQENLSAQYPEGARGLIRFNWLTGNTGHVINWEKINGKIVWIDAQNSTISDSYFSSRMKNIEWIRLDNLEPNADVLQYLEGTDS